jgi:DNA-binding response OmpR family regulator
MSIEQEAVSRPLELEEVTMTINEFNRRQELAVAEGRRLERQHILKTIHENSAQGYDWVVFLLEGTK